MKKTTNRAQSAQKETAKRVNNKAKAAKVEATAKVMEAETVEAVDVNEAMNEQTTYAPVVVESAKVGKVSSKEVLKAAGSLRAAVKEERRGANCTIRLIAERAAAGDAAAVDVLCALCDVPRAALFSLNIDIIRAAVNAYYPYFVEVDGRKVSVKPVGVWYSTAAKGELAVTAASRVERGYITAPVLDYLEQLIRAAKCRAKGVTPRRVDDDAVYSNIELSEVADGITAAEIDEAKKRKAYLSGAVNVWKKDRNGYYI